MAFSAAWNAKSDAGPVFFVILETSISNGAKQALAVSLGAVIADIGLIAIAFYIASSILQKPENQPQLYFVGGAILFFYGINELEKYNGESMVEFKEKVNIGSQVVVEGIKGITESDIVRIK